MGQREVFTVHAFSVLSCHFQTSVLVLEISIFGKISEIRRLMTSLVVRKWCDLVLLLQSSTRPHFLGGSFMTLIQQQSEKKTRVRRNISSDKVQSDHQTTPVCCSLCTTAGEIHPVRHKVEKSKFNGFLLLRLLRISVAFFFPHLS